MKGLTWTAPTSGTTRELACATAGTLELYVAQVVHQVAISTNLTHVFVGKCDRVPIAPPMKGLTGTAPTPSTTRELACATVGTLGLYVA